MKQNSAIETGKTKQVLEKPVQQNRCYRGEQNMQQLHAIEYPKMATNIAQASASEPKAPWRYSGGIWTNVGLILGPPGAHVRAFSGCTFASVCLLLSYCWCSFSDVSSAPLIVV